MRKAGDVAGLLENKEEKDRLLKSTFWSGVRDMNIATEIAEILDQEPFAKIVDGPEGEGSETGTIGS